MELDRVSGSLDTCAGTAKPREKFSTEGTVEIGLPLGTDFRNSFLTCAKSPQGQPFTVSSRAISWLNVSSQASGASNP